MLNIELLYDLAISLLSMHEIEMQTYVQIKTWMWMFTLTLFLRVQMCKCPKYSVACSSKGLLFSNKNEVLIYATVRIRLENITLSERSQS